MKTPIPHDNRPGLDAVRYRVGTYGDFKETMLARLSSGDPRFEALNALRTRSLDDPTIALIDAFAVVGDVLTFYQERLTNEGYLRTARERRSLEELARLTGYRLRPGVASSAFLAFTLDPSSAVTAPAGSRAQSVPGPGQTPQSFETSDDLSARGAWNVLRPRLTQPTQAKADLSQIVVSGVSTGLKPNDPLLLVVNGAPTLRRVADIEPVFDRKRTVISFQPLAQTPTQSTSQPAPQPPPPAAAPTAPGSPRQQIAQRAADLAVLARIAPAAHPPNAQALIRSPAQNFAPAAESSLMLTAGVSTAQRAAVFRALAQSQLTPQEPAALEAHAFRASTAPFGNRAPPPVSVDANGRLNSSDDWRLWVPTFGPQTPFSVEMTANVERPPPLRAFLSRFVASSEGPNAERLELLSTITCGEAAAQLPLRLENGASASAELSSGGGKVTATLTFEPGVLEFVYDFSDQPLKLSVMLAVPQPQVLSVSNLKATDAEVTLQASERLTESSPVFIVRGSFRSVTGEQPTETPGVLYLDSAFETITPGSWVAFDAPVDANAPTPPPMKVQRVNTVSRVCYGQTAQTTRLELPDPWLPKGANFARAIRQTAVYAQSAPLEILHEDLTDPVAQTHDDPTLELDGLVTGLTAGRWLVVNGERTDMPGVVASELVMLSSVAHGGESAPEGETPHTKLTFSSPLSYSYRRDTVQVFGNVVAATQGESCDEILGGGDGALANQSFTLKKPPVTFVPAVTPSGAESTLHIYVNNLEWKEVESLVAAAADARVFVTTVAEDGKVTVRFGDGVCGARPPTGAENIRARYRSGLGQSGNVNVDAITSLLSRPLGVKSVTNPIAATGGADAESPDDARRNIPIGLTSLGRLVSTADYRDFALAFAGIGKASALLFAGADGPLLHLTLAGAKDGALDPTDALWSALEGALWRFGDPTLETQLAPRVAQLAVIQAAVTVESDRLWTDVEPIVRSTLLETFGFVKRDLGQTLYVSELIAAIQGVRGVSYVDLQLLTGVPQPTNIDQLRAAITAGGVRDLIAHPARVDTSSRQRPRKLLPAEIVYLSDLLPDLLVLSEIKR